MNNTLGIRSVSIVLPTYNEAGHIRDLVLEIARSVSMTGIPDVEIIVVDDDSPDRTWEIVSTMSCPDAEVRSIRRVANRGLTSSLNEGISVSCKEVIVWLDADFSQPPDCIPQLLEKIAEGFDVVVNSRYIEGGGENRSGTGGRLQLFLSKYLNRMLQHVLIPSFYDYTSGFIAVRREVFSTLRLQGDYGEYFIDFIYRVLRAGRYKVCELPYIMQPRRSGTSKTGSNLVDFMLRGWKYLGIILRLRLTAR